MLSKENCEGHLAILLLCTLIRSYITLPPSDMISALIGFLLSLMPLSMQLMGWRGAVGGGAATIGWHYFAGGLLMILGGVGEVCLLST